MADVRGAFLKLVELEDGTNNYSLPAENFFMSIRPQQKDMLTVTFTFDVKGLFPAHDCDDEYMRALCKDGGYLFLNFLNNCNPFGHIDGLGITIIPPSTKLEEGQSSEPLDVSLNFKYLKGKVNDHLGD